MIFTETKLKGAFTIEPEKVEDRRGFFARTYCQREFEENGLNFNFVQCNISFNKKKATLRGMHYQVGHSSEAKLIRCTQGSVYDVIIDLIPRSETYKEWTAVELSAENRKMLFVPEHFAHGFYTLEENTEVFYQMSEFFAPERACGIRWNDPVFNIVWPGDVAVISEKDATISDFLT